MYIALVYQSYSFLLVSTAMNGFMNLSIFAVHFELGVELSYPIGEAMSGGVINTVTNIISLLLILILTPIVNINEEIDVLICFLIFTALLIVSLILIAVAPLKLRRMGI
jgi:hypothetical protein